MFIKILSNKASNFTFFSAIAIILSMKKVNNEWCVTYAPDKETIKKAIILDNMVFNKIDSGTVDMWLGWTQVETNIFTFLWHNNNLIGYMSLIPLYQKAYNQILKGKLRGYELKQTDIKPYKKGDYKCLLESVVVHPDYRDSEAILKLWEGFIQNVNELKTKGVNIVSVVADCVSVDGIKYMVNNFKSRYICNSSGGKIYEGEFFNREKVIPKLELKEITPENIKIIGKMQYDIFNKYEEVGYLDFKAETKIKNRLNKKILPITYLAYNNNEPVGFIGLYEYDEYPDDVWINWLGVREDRRRRGIGTQLLFKIVGVARQYDKKNLRLQTYKNLNFEAQSIYRKTMQIVETYTNSKDNKFNHDEVLIYSLSLKDKIAPLWSNKYIDINDEFRLHQESVEALKKDKVI